VCFEATASSIAYICNEACAYVSDTRTNFLELFAIRNSLFLNKMFHNKEYVLSYLYK
jgi:hypothetical protein